MRHLLTTLAISCVALLAVSSARPQSMTPRDPFVDPAPPRPRPQPSRAEPTAVPSIVPRAPSLSEQDVSARLPRVTANELLKSGNEALRRSEYLSAEEDARKILRLGDGTLQYGNAKFLLAQASEGLHNFQQAAVAYDDAYNFDRTGSLASRALLGLARSLNAIREKRAACAVLDKLRAEFPRVQDDISIRAADLRRDANCR